MNIILIVKFFILIFSYNSIAVDQKTASTKDILVADKGYYIGNINDSRIKYAIWHPTTIYNIRCVIGQISTIVFEDNEEIERIVMNDQSRWSIQNIGNELYIRAKHSRATDVIQVMTNKRKYIFEVSVNDGIDNKDPLAIITMKFLYPNSDNIFIQVEDDDEELEDDVPNIQNSEYYNFNYMISKANPEIHPLRIYDDGRSTYFYFSNKQEIPAFFGVDQFGQEVSVNVRRSNKYKNIMIVNGVYIGMVLRAGEKTRVVIKNQGFKKEDVVQC
ncbi:MAG: TrbG/VirB9 family P-type conjugative transfer protein [Pseudomonadota bacterium]